MIDSETKGPSDLFPTLVTERPINQDDDTCYYRVGVREDEIPAFEEALNQDDDVVSYEVMD